MSKPEKIADLVDQVIVLCVSFPFGGHVRVAGRVRNVQENTWVGELCLPGWMPIELDLLETEWKVYAHSASLASNRRAAAFLNVSNEELAS